LTGEFKTYLDEETEEDVLTLHKWFVESDPETMTCRPVSITDTNKAIENFYKRKESGFLNTYAIRSIEDNNLVGRVSYFDINPRNGAVEVGYMIGLDFRKRGFAYDAMTQLLVKLFMEMGLKKACAQTGEFNKASIALLLKFGFKQDGRLRNHHELNGKYYDDLLFSILSSEFKLLF
jgi:ribosomal-protein-alanine N-acetyltransferase